MSDAENTRFDVYRAVTDTIITAIEEGAGEFVMPWHGSGSAIAKPENALTKMEYHGINIIALWAQAHLGKYQSGYWASYKQWQQAGAQVRKGENGATVVFFKKLDDAEGMTDGTERTRPRMVARASRVFNADQVAGWQPPMPQPSTNRVDILACVAAFVAATGAKVTHGASGAWYDVRRDLIELPALERFTGSPTCTPSEAYHATLLHELVHWTGAADRLDRKLLDRSPGNLAREELTAEIGAAFLCADLHVTNTPRPDHAAYVAHWLQLLRNDVRAIFNAARLASAAATFLHDFADKPNI